MKREDLANLPQRYQDQIAAQLSRDLSRTKAIVAAVPETAIAKPARRIRQDSKPLLNKLEGEWFEQIKNLHPDYPPVRPQAKRYQIGRGAWYKPDFTCSAWPATSHGAATTVMETAWECKGPSCVKGVAKGLLALKVAAHEWPEVRFVLAWKEGGKWFEQAVLP